VSSTPLTDFASRAGLAHQLKSRLVTPAGYGIFYGGFENLGGAPDPGYTYPYAVKLSFFERTTSRHSLIPTVSGHQPMWKGSPDQPSIWTIHYRLGQALFRGGANEGAKKKFAEFERLHAQETADTGK